MDLTLAHQLSKLVHDPSPIIRMELVFVLSSLIYYQQEEFREYHNKQKQLKKEQRRRQKEEQEQMKQEKEKEKQKQQQQQHRGKLKSKKSQHNTSKSRSLFKTKSSTKLKRHQHSESYQDITSLAHSSSPKFKHNYNYNNINNPLPQILPSLQATQSVPPQRKPVLSYTHGSQSSIPTYAAAAPYGVHRQNSNNHNHAPYAPENRISPLVVPMLSTDAVDLTRMPTAESSTDYKSHIDHSKDEPSVSFPDLSIKDQEYEQRKRIWEVIKVLCKDPIAEISRNANKVKSYMTSDKVKSSRSRALSDPEKHAKLLQNIAFNANSNVSEMITN